MISFSNKLIRRRELDRIAGRRGARSRRYSPIPKDYYETALCGIAPDSLCPRLPNRLISVFKWWGSVLRTISPRVAPPHVCPLRDYVLYTDAAYGSENGGLSAVFIDHV